MNKYSSKDFARVKDGSWVAQRERECLGNAGTTYLYSVGSVGTREKTAVEWTPVGRSRDEKSWECSAEPGNTGDLETETRKTAK
jgi:hypothetical protein